MIQTTNQLNTITTISDGNRIIYMNICAFEDHVVVFEPPSSKVYTCRISIMSENNTLNSMEEPCSYIDARSKLFPIIILCVIMMLNCDSIYTADSSKSRVPIIVGCVAGVLTVLILIIVILISIKKGKFYFYMFLNSSVILWYNYFLY